MNKINISFGRSLFLCFVFIGAMIGARILYSGSWRFVFMSWNLFLGWIPYLTSLLFKPAERYSKNARILLFGVWLLFFPNALYIVTDIIHLEETERIPLWYDAVLLFMCSFAGLAMAFASVVNTEEMLRKCLPAKQQKFMRFFVITIFFVGSFGVYLGRFQRWNSWNIINDPLSLVTDILSNFISPIEHYRTWAVTILLTVLYSVVWFFINAFTLLRPQREKY